MKTEILLKELDLIDSTISRLDSQIQNSKNVCIILWTAWIGWFITIASMKNLVVVSVIFPVLFWFMDFNWRKALLTATKRQLRISIFFNAVDIKQRLNDAETGNFPLLDPVGWLFKKEAYAIIEEIINQKSVNSLSNNLNEKKRVFILKKNISSWDVINYKESIWFFLSLIIISLTLGIFIVYL